MSFILADARCIPLRDACVQCVVTSPPYFGLRDYGVSGQIGLESSPDAYVEQIVQVFREVKRVLKADGVCWVNLGDSYNAYNGNRGASTSFQAATEIALPRLPKGAGLTVASAKNKDLLGVPWRVAFALQADGWYLRSDVIWHKPNPMPESVTDRPTKAHEYLFLLTKGVRYFYDAAAIREPVSGTAHARGNGVNPKAKANNPGSKQNASFSSAVSGLVDKRNKRSVWTVPTMPYAGAHFATMPEKLVEPCVLAGSRPGDLVFDPFIGSGTVGAVAERLGRRWVGTDLNPAYHALVKTRTAQRGVLLESWR